MLHVAHTLLRNHGVRLIEQCQALVACVSCHMIRTAHSKGPCHALMKFASWHVSVLSALVSFLEQVFFIDERGRRGEGNFLSFLESRKRQDA